ncbi:MAG TPA: ATP-binding protein, partial [Luteolibacter sp.]|nr:ATP-binding protein [Luteolibacter sp.]
YTLVVRDGQPVFVLDSSFYIKNQGDETQIAMPGEVYEEAPEALMSAWKSGRAVSCEEPYTDKWGTFISAFAPFRDEQGQSVGMVGVDISLAQLALRQRPVRLALALAALCCLFGSALIGLVRARSHASLIQREAELMVARADAERGEQAARAGEHSKSVFLATMSHEIRTPLNGVLGMAEALAQTPLNADQKEQVKAIKSSGHLLLVMLNDILDFSKIEAGSMVVRPEPVHLRSLIEGAANLYRGSAENKGLELIVEFGPGAPRHAFADPNRVSQILGNLLSNAVKFTRRGTIHLRTAAAGGTKVVISVEDSGIGIPQDRIKDLFVPFSQLDTALNRQVGGSGLGLAISRRLAELMGGQLTVESREGRGSVFHLELPLGDLTPAEPEQAREEKPVEPLTMQLRVLVAEDVAINRQVAGLLLKRLGITPSFAEDGEEALQRWREERPDVILMDVQMPLLDGREATRRIRAETGDPHHPWIIALTGGVTGEDIDEAAKAGMNDFLAKPIDLAGLAAAMARVPQHRG